MKLLASARSILLGMILLVAACTQQPAPPVQVQTVQPGVSFGYVNNQYMAHVVNPDGTTYLMDYLLFTNLMNSGGYNAVSSYYYTHPGGVHLHVWGQGAWQPSYTSDATRYGTMYRTSYHDVYIHHHVYVPVTHSATPGVATQGPAANPIADKREITVGKVATAPVSTQKSISVAKVSTPSPHISSPHISAAKSGRR